jgi:LPPG:FO 2-phospho-L-lactate transferase
VRVVLLSGGVGGARFACGLRDALEPGELTVIGNVGDDLEILGLYVSPDLDSIMYALAGLADEVRGWGRAHESWNALSSVAAWGGEDWFQLGDLDLGLHLVRTHALHGGALLSEVTEELVARAELDVRVLPATDDQLRTHVVTEAGTLSFQEWFVRRGHQDEVDDVIFQGAESASPAPGVLESLGEADAIVIAPSNPHVSIGPILAVSAIHGRLEARRVSCVAVSPLIGGTAVKGPAGRMLSRMAGGTTPAHVASCYEGLIDALVIDEADAPADAPVKLVVTRTLMRNRDASRHLAEVALEAACA